MLHNFFLCSKMFLYFHSYTRSLWLTSKLATALMQYVTFVIVLLLALAASRHTVIHRRYHLSSQTKTLAIFLL